MDAQGMTEVERLRALNAYLFALIDSIGAVLTSGPGDLQTRVAWVIAQTEIGITVNESGLLGAEQAVLVFPDGEVCDQFLQWLSNSGEQDYMEAAEQRGEPHSFVFNYNHTARRVLVMHSGDEEEE